MATELRLALCCVTRPRQPKTLRDVVTKYIDDAIWGSSCCSYRKWKRHYKHNDPFICWKYGSFDGNQVEWLRKTCTSSTVAYRGGVWGCSTPPPLKFRSFDKAAFDWKLRTPTPQDIRKKGSKILKLPRFAVGLLAMTNKLVVVLNRLKYQKLRKFYHMKWNFLYQITAGSRTPN